MTMIERSRFAERGPFFWIGSSVLTATMTGSGRHAERSPFYGIGRIAGNIANFVYEKARQRRHRKALLELNEMADWQLNDIGITRSAVEDALFARK